MWNYIAKIAEFWPKFMKKMHFGGHAVSKLSNMVRWKYFFASKTKTCYRYGIYLQQVFVFDAKNASLWPSLQNLTLQLECENDQKLQCQNLQTRPHRGIFCTKIKILLKVYTIPISSFCFWGKKMFSSDHIWKFWHCMTSKMHFFHKFWLKFSYFRNISQH